jgi:flagellar biogenesis protein FliO
MRSIAVGSRISVVFIQVDEYALMIAHVDTIKWLKDPDLFYHELSKEVCSNPSQPPESTHQDPLSDRGTVINALGTR